MQSLAMCVSIFCWPHAMHSGCRPDVLTTGQSLAMGVSLMYRPQVMQSLAMGVSILFWPHAIYDGCRPDVLTTSQSLTFGIRLMCLPPTSR